MRRVYRDCLFHEFRAIRIRDGCVIAFYCSYVIDRGCQLSHDSSPRFPPARPVRRVCRVPPATKYNANQNCHCTPH